jgi:hypothetical protein
MTSRKKSGKAKARRKTHHKRRSKNLGFLGIDLSDEGKPTVKSVAVQTALSIGTAILGAAAGSAFGSASVLALGFGIMGIVWKIPALAAFGFTAAATPLSKDADKLVSQLNPGPGGTPIPATATTSATATNGFDDLEGLNLKQFGADAKARVEAYFKNLAEKVTFGKYKGDDVKTAIQTVQGLFGPDESVSYFLNPGTSGVGEVDLSALDKIQQQVAQLSAGSQSSLSGDEFEEDDFSGII